MGEAEVNIHITLVTYALSVRTLVYNLSGSDVTWHLFTHSDKPNIVAECIELASEVPSVRLHDYRVNRGLARSWNDGIVESAGADAIVIINDDVSATRSDLDTLVSGALAHPEAGMIVCEGYNERMVEQQILGYAVFAVNLPALNPVLLFDENLAPIYFEDCDHSRRCSLAGVAFYNVGRTGMVHRGSATVNTDLALKAQNNVTFARNLAYYVRKWGGEPGQETFSLPFNDPAFGYQIAASQRHDPYPGRGRTDIQELVRV